MLRVYPKLVTETGQRAQKCGQNILYGFSQQPPYQTGFLHPCPCSPAACPAGCWQSLSPKYICTIKIFKNLRNKGVSALISRDQDIQLVPICNKPLYPLPKAMKSGPQRLQNSLLIAVACGLRGILVPEFSLVPTASEHRLVYMKW